MDTLTQQLADVVASFDGIQEPDSMQSGMVLVTRAKVAVDRTFPADHPYRTEVETLFKACQRVAHGQESFNVMRQAFFHVRGLLCAALHDYSRGFLRSLTRAVEMKTVEDVLIQADLLLSAGVLPAAAVLAGAALETHLRALVEAADLAVEGAGSISDYNAAIRAQEKGGKTPIYDKEWAKEVIALGGLRNEAAHKPVEFDAKRRREDVRLMIDRVRHFIRSHG